eukprot:7386288-Prymnesium_polylepis.1
MSVRSTVAKGSYPRIISPSTSASSQPTRACPLLQMRGLCDTATEISIILTWTASSTAWPMRISRRSSILLTRFAWKFGPPRTSGICRAPVWWPG